MKWICLAVATALVAIVAGRLQGSASASTDSYPDCNKGDRVDQIAGFQAAAKGARARWTVRVESAPYYNIIGDHMNHTIWVGANGQDPKTTWVEVGTLAGSQNADLQNHWTYYSARAINYPSSYAAVNFDAMGPPPVGTTHLFSTWYTGSSFQVNIDSASHYYWASVTGPTVEYDVGFEGICASSQGSVDTHNRTYVSELDSLRTSDGSWVQSDHGTFKNDGSSAGGIAWCNEPYTFRDWLNSLIDTNPCS